MSIFDDDNPSPWKREEKSDGRPDRDNLHDRERREPSIEGFEPIDSNRNRHLSSSLSSIRDNGPADDPEPQPGQEPKSQPESQPEPPILKTEEPRNPFMSATPQQEPKPEPPTPKPQPAKVQPEAPKAQTRPAPPPPPPEFTTSHHRQNIGFSTLLSWALLLLVVILSGWNMVQLSTTDSRISDLANRTDSLEQTSGPEQPSENKIVTDLTTRLAALESRIDTLTTQISTLQEQLASANQSDQLAGLSARIDALQKELNTSAVKSAPATQAPKAASPAPESNSWFINIASLADRQNAINLRDKAKSLGADTRMESYPSQGRILYRIRAYGYSSQSAAEKDAQRLQTALNLSGLWVAKKE